MNDAILMLVLINPFSQVLYLRELMNELSARDFFMVNLRASILSFGVFALFVITGDWIVQTIFQVRLGSLQIFGGLIMLYIAYRYVTVGAGSNLLFRGNITELAPQISLPYMVGPGTIWMAIVIGEKEPAGIALLYIAVVLAVNHSIVVMVQFFYSRAGEFSESIIGKYFAILMRTNALFIGAVAVELILQGVQSIFTGEAGLKSVIIQSVD